MRFLNGPFAVRYQRLGSAADILTYAADRHSNCHPTEAPAVEDDPNKRLTLRTDLVTLTLTVTDLYGRYVSGLNKKAFSILDNNQEQDITYFSDSDAPVSVGILVRRFGLDERRKDQ